MEDRTLLSTWVPKGPASILESVAPGGDPSSGRITALAADPIDLNTIYIAAAGGGVWKTIDGGSNWIPLTDAQSTLFMGAIAIAPSDPNTIYAGTGEATNSGLSFYGRGVLKSMDGGETWTLLGNAQFDRKTIAQIAVSPIDPRTVYVAIAGGGVNGLSGGTGIWKSIDGGTTWVNTTANLSTTEMYSDVEMDPSDPLTLYAAVGSRRGAAVNGIYKTTNGGNSWALAGNVPRGSSNGNTKIAIAPTNDLVVYASITDPTTGALAKMLKSTDGGVTWIQLSNTPNYMGNQGWYDSTLAVDPLTADTIYAAGSAGPNSFIRSLDGGATWSDISIGSNGHGPHVDHHGIDFDVAGRLLDGDDGGIWRLDNQAPVRWADLNGNLSITQFIGIAIHPINPNIAYGGSQDNGTEKFTGSLAWTQSAGSDGGLVRIDFSNPRTVYHSSQYPVGAAFLQRSDNGGNTWMNKTSGINLSDPANFYPVYLIDPSNSSRLLLGTNRVYETTDRADNWSPISAPNSNGWGSNGAIDSLAVAPSDGNTIYATVGNNLFVTTNDGGSWSQRNIPVGSHIQNLAVDPADSRIVYAVRDRFGSGHVFRTADGGITWSDISGNLPDLPTYTIVLGPGTLYVGNDEGVYSSTDGGATWSPPGDGLPHVQVRQVVLNMTLGILAAGTHGRGLWELNIGGAATHFSVVPSASSVTAGSTFQITVTALDNENHAVPGYAGTVHFVSTDNGATLPGEYTFTAADAGSHTFAVILIQAGSQTITVTDPAARLSGSITATVDPAAADHFSVRAPAGSTAGAAFDVTVTALDPFNNIDINYQGTVHFTSTDMNSGLDLPPDTTFTGADAGIRTFAGGVTLLTAGSQEVSVTDTLSGITGAAPVTVIAAAPDHLLITAPDTVLAGLAFDITVTVQDAFNNTVAVYLGTVQFSSSDLDPGVMLPPDYPFTSADAGMHTFAGGVILITVGSQTIIVTDPNLGISGDASVNVVSQAPPPGGANGPGDGLWPDWAEILKPLIRTSALRTSGLMLSPLVLNATEMTSLFAGSRVEHRTVILPRHSGWPSVMIDEWETLFPQDNAPAASMAFL